MLCDDRKHEGLFLVQGLSGKDIDVGITIKGALHTLFVSLDHLLHHTAAHGTGLTGCQIAVITLLEVYADFIGTFHFKLVKSLSCFGNIDRITVVRHKTNLLLLHNTDSRKTAVRLSVRKKQASVTGRRCAASLCFDCVNSIAAFFRDMNVESLVISVDFLKNLQLLFMRILTVFHRDAILTVYNKKHQRYLSDRFLKKFKNLYEYWIRGNGTYLVIYPKIRQAD